MKLSVIVIVYNITREAPRTLRSLSPSYQRGIAAEDYEVIVVENGSTERLGEEAVTRLGDNFHYHYLDKASPSPAAAINFGLRQAKGDLVGVMIDGARICTPGLLHAALDATRLYPRAIVATMGFYLGNGWQRFTVLEGYNRQVEDGLLEKIGWPEDGYRMFEVGHTDESSNFFRVLAESNALFMPRALWQELDGADERFNLPGGGLVNLDLFVRATELPDSELVVLLGEATFHQLHGGIATNASATDFEARVKLWWGQYEELRGKAFEAPAGKLRRYLGTMPASCLPHIIWQLNELMPPPFFADLKRYEASMKAAQAEAARASAEAAQAKAERDRLKRELEVLQGSHSWLLTRPLRSAFKRMLALRDSLGR